MKYEFMGIVKPFLPEDVRIQLLKSIKKLITSSDGKVEKEDLWGKRHLAYKIKGHEEGYYVLYFIELPSEKVVKVEEELRMTNDLLRYILIKRD
ncbi:30S ribosomal protein S6 [Patescibacteria group bacterium]